MGWGVVLVLPGVLAWAGSMAGVGVSTWVANKILNPQVLIFRFLFVKINTLSMYILPIFYFLIVLAGLCQLDTS